MNIQVFADRNSPGSTWGKLGVSVTVIDYVHIFTLSNLVVFEPGRPNKLSSQDDLKVT